jgi:hypothetical protein
VLGGLPIPCIVLHDPAATPGRRKISPMSIAKCDLALAGLVLLASVALAQQAGLKPAIVYDLGGKFDKSFNEGVFSGAKQVQEGVRCRILGLRASE